MIAVTRTVAEGSSGGGGIIVIATANVHREADAHHVLLERSPLLSGIVQSLALRIVLNIAAVLEFVFPRAHCNAEEQ